jgi:hypothetical protein
MAIRKDVLHHYKYFRAHQMSVYHGGGGTLTRHQDSGKVERSYGSAPYGEHAISAYWSARNQIRFRKDLKDSVISSKKRSKAAKRSWITRRAAA